MSIGIPLSRLLCKFSFCFLRSGLCSDVAPDSGLMCNTQDATKLVRVLISRSFFKKFVFLSAIQDAKHISWDFVLEPSVKILEGLLAILDSSL